MNRGTLRTLLQKRLQDTVSDQFDPSELNDLLNMGLSMLQNEIMAVRPDAFAEISTFDLVQDQDRYENPEGWLMDFMLEVTDNSTESGWRKLDPLPLHQKDVQIGESIKYFSHLGRFVILTPTPTVAVDEGLRRTWVPTLTMSDDADIPYIKTGLHTCIVDFAVIEALGESDESGTATIKRLERKLERIPDLYGRVLVGQSYGLVPNVAR